MNEKGIVILWFGGRADFQGLVVDHGHNCTSHSHARSETQEEVVTDTITLNDRGDKQGKSKSNTHRLWMEKYQCELQQNTMSASWSSKKFSKLFKKTGCKNCIISWTNLMNAAIRKGLPNDLYMALIILGLRNIDPQTQRRIYFPSLIVLSNVFFVFV